MKEVKKIKKASMIKALLNNKDFNQLIWILLNFTRNYPTGANQSIFILFS